MISKSFAVAVALTIVSFGNSHAETLSSYGSRTCDQWELWQRGQPTSDTIASNNWIFGTLEGIADFAESDSRMRGAPAVDVLRGLDGPIVIALVKEYCRPQLILKDAVSAVGAQLVAETGLRISGNQPRAVTGSRVLVVSESRPVETTGAAVVERTGAVVVAKPGACEALVVNGRTATGQPVTRILQKCD